MIIYMIKKLQTILFIIQRHEGTASAVSESLFIQTVSLILHYAGLILGLPPATKRRRYKVKPSLIGWAQT